MICLTNFLGIALVLLSISAKAAEECKFSELADKTKAWIAKTEADYKDPACEGKDQDCPHYARRNAVQRVIVLREASRLCAYGAPNDKCASQACNTMSAWNIKTLCEHAPKGALREHCRQEAIEAQTSIDQAQMGFQLNGRLPLKENVDIMVKRHLDASAKREKELVNRHKRREGNGAAK